MIIISSNIFSCLLAGRVAGSSIGAGRCWHSNLRKAAANHQGENDFKLFYFSVPFINLLKPLREHWLSMHDNKDLCGWRIVGYRG